MTPLDMTMTRSDAAAGAAVVSTSPSALEPADMLKAALASLEDSKAEDITAINVTGKSSLADHMVVATGRSNRHVGAIADRIVEDLNKVGVRGIKVEGLPHCDWVLIDAGDVIVHVFRPEVRLFYNIEKMWSAEPIAERRLG
jgi:ribosome-associated protein